VLDAKKEILGVRINNLPHSYACKHADNHQYTDDYQAEELGSVFLSHDPSKNPSP